MLPWLFAALASFYGKIHCDWQEVLLSVCSPLLGCHWWCCRKSQSCCFTTALQPGLGCLCNWMLLRRKFWIRFTTFVDVKSCDLSAGITLAEEAGLLMLLLAAVLRSAVSICIGVWLVSLMTSCFMPHRRPLSLHRPAPHTSCWRALCPLLPRAYWWVTSRPNLFNGLKLDSSTRSPLLHLPSPSQSLGAGVL